MSICTLTLHLSYWDQVTLRRLLFRGKKRCERDLERQEERGWQPEPGKTNVAAVTLRNIDSLLERLPDPGVLGEPSVVQRLRATLPAKEDWDGFDPLMAEAADMIELLSEGQTKP